METIHRDFASKDVNIYFIYKTLAHPEGGKKSYVQPFTIEERLAHIKEAKKTLGSTIPWICDNMDNELKRALGSANNSEFVFDPEGKVVRLRDWSNPQLLRQDLEELVGKVDKPTRVTDLNIKTASTRRPATKQVVPKLRVPGNMQAVKLEPKPGDNNPFYVKLRAELDSSALRGGKGNLYLGFHLDPLYDVHWNNLAKPITYEIATSDGVKVSPLKGVGPKIEQESDVDPREFLLDVEGLRKESALRLTVRYFACNDEEGWCKPVSQLYLIYPEVDKDAGRVFARGGRGRGGRGRSNRPQRGGRRPF